MSSEIQNDDSYLNRISIDTMYFYSPPSSPSQSKSRPYETAPSTPKTYADSDSDSDSSEFEFEFEASRRFINDEHDFDTGFETERNFEYLSDQDLKQQRQHSDSLPPMAFADDLFSDGKVLPLKLPPRLHTVNGNLSPTLSSPRSPNSGLKLPFLSWSTWRDDFDPFMVALENVKEDGDGGRGKLHESNFHRRARSLSPLRSISPQRPKPRPNDDMGLTGPISNQPGAIIPIQQNEPNKIGPQERMIQIGQSPIRLAEPKGLEFARKTRLVKMGHESPSKPNVITSPRPTVDSTKETKRQKVKKFLFRNSWRKEVGSKEPNGGIQKPKLMRKLSFRPRNSAQMNEDKRLARVNRATVVQYRPRLFLCLGYGSKGLRYVK